MKLLTILAITALAAFVACKSDSNTVVPPSTQDVFGFKTGGYFEFQDFEVDTATNKVIDGTMTLIHARIVETGMSMYGKSDVAMIRDSVFNFGGDTLLFVDTAYVVAEANGTRLSQYGFVADLVKRYSNGALLITPKWNMLVATDTTAFWTTDTSSAAVPGFGTAFETLQGSNQGKGTYHLNNVGYSSGVAFHTGALTVGAMGAPIKMSVQAIFNPTIVASVITQPATLITFKINQHQRILTSFIAAP